MVTRLFSYLQMAAAYRQLGMIRKVDGVTAKEIILIIEEQNIIPDPHFNEISSKKQHHALRRERKAKGNSF